MTAQLVGTASSNKGSGMECRKSLALYFLVNIIAATVLTPVMVSAALHLIMLTGQKDCSG